MPNHQTATFIAGFSDKLKIDAQLARPTTLEEAMSLARAYEQRLWLEKAPESRKVVPRGSSTPTVGANPQSGTPVPTTFVKRLTRAEMAERRAKGLCYNCDEQFTSEHRCKKLFWLEILSPDEEQESTAPVEEFSEPEISIHALTGSRNG